MSILVDTSVWSHALRRGSPSSDPQVARLASLLRQKQPILLLGIILQEILQGIKDESRFEMIRRHLESFPLLTLSRQDYVAASKLVNACRSKGIQVSTVDAQIAAVCNEHGYELLTCDRDFQQIATVCPLRLM